ncbi:MAG TPA: transcriptional regulator [Candidatus Saccharicenans sp.]|jgi:DNA-binding HxlR family transcriptional regulator|nr:transcriptional regulator [Candidatus Saccharicenans sp.]HRD02449.1 transcriptional regulator [Candidatus Saccharicenans sp.]
MTINKFPPLDPVIHSQVRLAVLSVLIGVKEADFNYLKKVTETTDGNLSTHLSKLEEAGYMTIKKSFKGKKPVTTCSITEKGKRAFARYLEALKDYLPPASNQETKE